MTSHPIYLIDKRTGNSVAAELIENIRESHLAAVETEWMPVVITKIKELVDQGKSIQSWPQSWHWKWRDKVGRIKGLLAFKTFAIECGGRLQGLMQLNMSKATCRLPEQVGKDLIYVDYVETAPWNRTTITDSPQYSGVGAVMIRAAIAVSQEEDFHGRIGLHSLPQSEAFYSDVCGMSDLGLDPGNENLRYFEMTSEQAKTFSN